MTTFFLMIPLALAVAFAALRAGTLAAGTVRRRTASMPFFARRTACQGRAFRRAAKRWPAAILDRTPGARKCQRSDPTALHVRLVKLLLRAQRGLIAILAALGFVAGSAAADTAVMTMATFPCMAPAEQLAILKEKYGEEPVTRGIAPKGDGVVIVTVSPEGTFTMLASAHQGKLLCMLAAGKDWTGARPKAGKDS